MIDEGLETEKETSGGRLDRFVKTSANDAAPTTQVKARRSIFKREHGGDARAYCPVHDRAKDPSIRSCWVETGQLSRCFEGLFAQAVKRIL